MDYNTKYELIRHLILEEFNGDLSNFHFTPGDKFLETPTIDIVTMLVDTIKGMSCADHRPPRTGITPKNLI